MKLRVSQSTVREGRSSEIYEFRTEKPERIPWILEMTGLEAFLLSGHCFIPRQPVSYMLTSPKLFQQAKSVTTNYRLANQEILLILRNYNFLTVCTTDRRWTLV
jgi:hypothetical protein